MDPSGQAEPVPTTFHPQAVWYVLQVVFGLVVTLILAHIQTTAATRDIPPALIITIWLLVGYILLRYATMYIRLEGENFTYNVLLKRVTCRYSSITKLAIESRTFTNYAYKYGPLRRSIRCIVIADTEHSKELVISSKPFSGPALKTFVTTVAANATSAAIDDNVRAVERGEFRW